MVPHGALECPDVLRRIVRVNQKLPLGSLDLFEGGADELLICPVDELDAALCVGSPHRRRATVRHCAEALFTLAQRVLRPPAAGNVRPETREPPVPAPRPTGIA